MRVLEIKIKALIGIPFQLEVLLVEFLQVEYLLKKI